MCVCTECLLLWSHSKYCKKDNNNYGGKFFVPWTMYNHKVHGKQYKFSTMGQNNLWVLQPHLVKAAHQHSQRASTIWTLFVSSFTYHYSNTLSQGRNDLRPTSTWLLVYGRKRHECVQTSVYECVHTSVHAPCRYVHMIRECRCAHRRTQVRFADYILPADSYVHCSHRQHT